MPGGSAAIREPWRMAVSHLVGLYGEEEAVRLPLGVIRQAGERNVRLIARLIERNLNTPPTSSAGRLFDAVSALAGLPGSHRTTYEGQAAIELELAAKGHVDLGYPFLLRDEGEGWVVETREVMAGVVEDLSSGREVEEISAKFHRTMAEVVACGCERVRERSGTNVVALSGGTFQNMLLLEQAIDLLVNKGFIVHRHRRAPTSDGGLALGQAVLANAMSEQKEIADKLKC